jgi:hypothetical protein
VAVERWQVSHARPVRKWLAGFAVAPPGLWQLAQVPGATLACANTAGSQAVVRWHKSHDSAVARWLAGLAVALPPARWQVAQVRGITPTCENAPAAAVVDALTPAAREVPGTGVTGVMPLPGALPEAAAEAAEAIFDSVVIGALAAAAEPPMLVVVWQFTQSWLVVLPWWLPTVAVLRLTPYHFCPDGPWQLLHVGFDTALLLRCVPVITMNGAACGTFVPLNDVNVVAEWQVSHAVVPYGTCAGDSPVGVLIVTPYHAMPAAWQLAQPLVMPVWFIAVPGPNAVVEAWHTLQSSPVGIGMCAGEVVGYDLGTMPIWPAV